MSMPNTEVSTDVSAEDLGLDINDGENTTIIFASKDGKEFKVEYKYAKLSVMVQQACANEGDIDKKTIPIPVSFPSDAVSKMVEYLNHHKGVAGEKIKKPLKSNDFKEIAQDPFDFELLQVANQTLCDIILVANYLDIKCLLDLACAKVASMIKGKLPEQIREVFGTENAESLVVESS